ncbi:MAG: class I SAM-dependent methyltransferase [Chloroflexi bacterium]|nr:class I SAM-dependent methyltransferase [Chloroflexota bacterium]
MKYLDSLSPLSGKRIAIHVKPAAERALRAGHPWLFAEAIRQQSHEGQPGDLAVVFDSKRRFLAIGLYDPHSPIRIKVLQHHQPAVIDSDWFTNRLQAAADIRQPLLTQQTNGFRLVHGENDGLPGLIIDRYADVLAIKLYTAAWLPHLHHVITGLQAVQPFDRLVLRISRNIETITSQHGLYDGCILMGDELHTPVIFQENGLNFAADVVHGHKTGFFFDQRENRARVRTLSAGRRVLDVFAYSGGFSVYAAAGGAASVMSLDASAPALEAAQANFALNPNHTQHKILVGDAFECLEQLRADSQTFDMVIVDPPSFAKSATEIRQALAAYTRLTRLALHVLEPGGIFVMASCSSRVTADDFSNTVAQTAAGIGRPLAKVAQTSHALDHPIGFPEGEYLKCIFATAP